MFRTFWTYNKFDYYRDYYTITQWDIYIVVAYMDDVTIVFEVQGWRDRRVWHSTFLLIYLKGFLITQCFIYHLRASRSFVALRCFTVTLTILLLLFFLRKKKQDIFFYSIFFFFNNKKKKKDQLYNRLLSIRPLRYQLNFDPRLMWKSKAIQIHLRNI